MPLSSLRGTLYTRAAEFGGETSTSLDIDGLSDIGEALADADLFIIDNGGGGTNAKTAITRIPTYTFSKISGVITVNSSGVAAYPTTVEATNLTLSGDLTVNGDTVSVNTTTVTVDDPMFALADNNSADSVDIGWYGKYVDSGTKYSGLFRDASDSDMWKLFATTGNSDAAPSTTVDTTSGFTLANLSVNELTGTIATAAQGNITSLGTLSALTVDDVAIDGKIVTMTGSSGDTATITVGTNGTLDITTTDTAAAAANIQITADGTAELAGTTVTLDSEGGITLDANGGTITFADDGVSLGTITSSGYSGAAATVTNTSQAITALTGGDLTIYDDANNADVSFAMGTSATESLTIQVLNGGSNKTAEEVHFSTATASGTSDHGKMVFDVDGTDIAEIDDSGINLASGKTFRVNGSAIAGTDTTYTAGDLLDLDGTEFDVDLTEAGEAAIANGDYILFLDGGATGTHAKEAIADVATLFAGTGLTASSSVIGVDASQAITALTGGDLTIYDDANNADVSLKLGTSATEALSIEVLNGGSNKTAEEVHFSTATASGTANHGKMVFDVDGTDIVEINDGGVAVTGELSATTLDINGTDIGATAAEINLLDGSAKSTSSITVADSDAFIVIDGTTTKQIPASDIKTYAAGASATKGFATAMAIAL